ncbi:MAG TPA: cytochrome c [Anaerolineales bacterium]|nr:cytochrome c [Anaerolineales bacterium]
MKFPSILLIVAAGLLLMGCNLTLAEDIQPPSDYVPPTPMPTLGPLYPASAPDVQKGAAIFAERCTPCHGATGLGDGPQSMQLPVAVPGIGLPEVAHRNSPAEWFRMVTQGNLDRFMPPFVSALSDQERWDVVAYALSLHTTSNELELGRALVERDCSQCPSVFGDLKKMASLSQIDLAGILRSGEGDLPAFGRDYSDEEIFAAAAHLRSLTFAKPSRTTAATTATAEQGQPEAAPLTETPAGTPRRGAVTGKIELGSSAELDGLPVTLHGFDHAPDQTSGPQEVLTIQGTVAPDGSYVFDEVELRLNRIFVADLEYRGITYSSDFEAAGADSSSIELPLLKVFEPSTDTSLLSMDQIHIYTDFATAGTVQVLEIFAFSNRSDRAVIISEDGVTIPFIQLPSGAINPGYEAGQGSETFVSADAGLAVLPSEKSYSIIAFFNLPFDRSLDFSQPLAIDAPRVLLLVPDGIRVRGEQLTNEGPQVVQNYTYQEYSAADLKAGESLTFGLSGRPNLGSAAGLEARQEWLIGGGLLGLALIFGGIFLYVRDRRKAADAPAQAEFQTSDEVLDAILALDDLHQAGKIPDQAYEARRAELKDVLRQIRK